MTDLADIFSDLVRAETELWNHLDRRLRAEVDLPLNRFEPLRVIGGHEACRIADIADQLAIGVSGTSKLVDRIEHDGLCVRQADPADRRSALISLTPAGTRLLRRAEKVFRAELELRLGLVLSRAKRAELAGALQAIRGAGSPNP